MFEHRHLAALPQLFRKVCADFGCELAEFNGETDPVHWRVNDPPKVAVSRLVNSLKGVSGCRLQRYDPELEQPAYRQNALWSPSYFAGSVGGAPMAVLRQYMEQQIRPF